VEAAQTNFVVDWQWTVHPWGVALELGFAEEDHWGRFRALPVVRAVLDAVPDRVNGLLIYTGRGGSHGSLVPRRPRPAPSSAAAEAPVPCSVLSWMSRLVSSRRRSRLSDIRARIG
jgi:hypothetical protein